MDEAAILLEMQERDLRIMRLEKQIDEMPEKRAILAARSKLADMGQLLARTEAVRHAVEAEMKRLEDDTAMIDVKMTAEQDKLLSGQLTNPKELQHISMELDGLKRHKESLESQEMERLEKREAAVAQSEKISAAIAVGQAKEAELVVEFKRHGSELIGELEKLRAERERLAAGLEPETRSRYQALIASKHGIAVGRLAGKACGVCRVTVPAGRLEELFAGPPVGACPNCGRMLVMETEDEDE